MLSILWRFCYDNNNNNNNNTNIVIRDNKDLNGVNVHARMHGVLLVTPVVLINTFR